MRRSRRALWQVAWWGALLSGVSGTLPLATAQEIAVVQPPATASAGQVSPTTPAAAELPDSPGVTVELRKKAAPQSDSGNQFAAMRSQALDTQSQQAQSQPLPDSPAQINSMPQSLGQKPVGTAAAGTVPVSGVAASQPTGVAIAPAKQRRVRTLVLRMGAIVGAGVAVGSVVALTQATPSKPPGAH